MNAVYRVVWSVSRNHWVVASELTRGRRKSGRAARRVAACGLGLIACTAHAVADELPTGGTVTSGTGAISRDGDAMTINQSGHQLDIDWQSFSIGRRPPATAHAQAGLAPVESRCGAESSPIILAKAWPTLFLTQIFQDVATDVANIVR
jgi:hypothetical protein